MQEGDDIFSNSPTAASQSPKPKTFVPPLKSSALFGIKNVPISNTSLYDDDDEVLPPASSSSSPTNNNSTPSSKAVTPIIKMKSNNNNNNGVQTPTEKSITSKLLSFLDETTKNTREKTRDIKFSDIQLKTNATVSTMKPSVNVAKKHLKSNTRVLTKSLVQSKRGVIFSIVSILLSTTSELYPHSPHFNVIVGCYYYYLHGVVLLPKRKKLGKNNEESMDFAERRRSLKKVLPNTPKTYFVLFGLFSLLSCILDLSWIASSVRPIDLESGLMQNPYQSKSITGQISDIAIVINIGVKIFLFYEVTRKEKFGKKLHAEVWRHLRFFIPTYDLPSNIKQAVAKRLIANCWLSLVCSLTINILSAISSFGIKNSPQLRMKDGGRVPLLTLMIIKGISSSLSTMTIFRNIDIGVFLNMFGCTSILNLKKWYKTRKVRLANKRGHKVRYWFDCASKPEG